MPVDPLGETAVAPEVAAMEARPAGRFLESRTLVAGLRRAHTRGRPAEVVTRLGAGEVFRDLQRQSGRVLPSAGGQPEDAARRGAEGAGLGGRKHPPAAGQDQRPGSGARREARRGFRRSARARSGRGRNSALGLGEPRCRRSSLSRRSVRRAVFPVLTPLAVDPGHPFPYISNLSLNLAVWLRDPDDGRRRFARVKVPPLLSRFLDAGDPSTSCRSRMSSRPTSASSFPAWRSCALPVPCHARQRSRARRRCRRGSAPRAGGGAASTALQPCRSARGRPSDAGPAR